MAHSIGKIHHLVSTVFHSNLPERKRASHSPIGLNSTAYYYSSSSSSPSPPVAFQGIKAGGNGGNVGAKQTAEAGSMGWWEKGVRPNMKGITSARDLVHSLAGAGETLVVVGFFSPGCGGCRALHPKICRFAEMNPEVEFLQVNREGHKSLCYSLNVHVLPFFRFYRGAQGRLCSFSCTNATVKKFRDALAKHGTERCSSLGPAKGLEESELQALAANRDLSFTYTTRPEPVSYHTHHLDHAREDAGLASTCCSRCLCCWSWYCNADCNKPPMCIYLGKIQLLVICIVANLGIWRLQDLLFFLYLEGPSGFVFL